MGLSRELNIDTGKLRHGSLNLISDVNGIKVGHSTITSDDIQTGVTAIIPHGESIFEKKLLAATHVINGFGKSIGLMQINELGTLETPIILTNTLSVVSYTHLDVYKRQVQYLLQLSLIFFSSIINTPNNPFHILPGHMFL